MHISSTLFHGEPDLINHYSSLTDGIEGSLTHVIRVTPVAKTGDVKNDEGRIGLPEQIIGEPPLFHVPPFEDSTSTSAHLTICNRISLLVSSRRILPRPYDLVVKPSKIHANDSGTSLTLSGATS